ncbi:MAG: aldo/keto reductase [Hyphomicrobiales bacterium]
MNKKLELPTLNMGTFQCKDEDLIEVILHGLEIGYQGIDTAQIYNNEGIIGKAIQQTSINRDDFFLTTKVWKDNLTKNNFIPSVEESLTKLNTDYVDLLLIHWPPRKSDLSGMYELLAKCKEENLCRYIGVSNFNIEQMEQAREMGIELYANQVEFHPLISQILLKEYLDKYGIKLMAYAPFASGQIFGNKTIKEMASRYRKTKSQVTLRWLLQNPNVYPVPKTMSRLRLEENINIFDFQLNEYDFSTIDALKRVNIRFFNPPALAPEWD